jgi:hypothetical protein
MPDGMISAGVVGHLSSTLSGLPQSSHVIGRAGDPSRVYEKSREGRVRAEFTSTYLSHDSCNEEDH